MNKYDKLIKRAKTRYSFLRETFIEVDDESIFPGLGANTQYQPSWEGLTKGSITIVASQVKWEQTTARYHKRLGPYKTYDQFFLLILLHEIAHVWQRQQYGDKQFNEAYRTVLDSQTHDENWLEVEADKWARAEFKRRGQSK